MFADIRGSTSIAEKVGPAEFANLLNRFYEVTTKSLLLQNAVVDKMTVHDLHATMLHLLGIDHERFTEKYHGLDLKLTGVEPARVVGELIA